MLPASCAELFAQALGATKTYLEYGSGGTTMAALRAGVPTLSVESDAAWHKAVSQRAGQFATPAHLIHVDIGPTENWGYPADVSGWTRYHTYPLAPWDKARALGLVPDLVLIDGRFRIACFLATLLFAPPGMRILFDDYADRAYSETLERFAAPERLVDRMAVFATSQHCDRDAIWQALLVAVTDPS